LSGRLNSSQLLAELVADALRPHAGGIGVIVRDVPSPDPEVLLARLEAMHEEEGFADLRVAYLRDAPEAAASAAGLGPDVLSTEVEQAERWRNDRDLDALIVVVAQGDEAKLSSLEDFATVTSQDLKRVLVERAMGGPAGENDVQALLWKKLARDRTVGLGQLADYYLALHDKEGAEFKAASSRELHRLGLLADPALFDDPKPAAMERRLASNREVVERLQMLNPKDRQTIKKVVEGIEDEDEKARLREALDQLHRTRSAGIEGTLDFEHAERLIKARTKKPPPEGGKGKPPRPATEKAAAVAAEALVDPERDEELGGLLAELGETLEKADETSVRTEKIRVQVPGATTAATATVRLDILNFVAKILDEGVYGGLVQVDLDDMDDLLRRFNVQEHVVARWEHKQIREVLDHIAGETSAGAELIAKFEAYDEARNAALPYLRPLMGEPVVVAVHKESRDALLAAIAAYGELTEAVRANYDRISEDVGSDVDELVGLLLLMDIVVIKGASRVFALLSPLHPLFLWHHATYAQLVEEQRDRLEEPDRKLVADAARRLPNFLTSVYVPASATGSGSTLNFAGKIGELPYYSDEVEGSSSDDGLEAISTLFKGFLALEPHARAGFRVALVDPPDAGAYLRLMVDLSDSGAIDGAHLVVYRPQSSRLAIELRLDEEDEDRVAQLFRALNASRRFTFEVRDLPPEAVGPGPDESFHVAVVFDRSGGRATRARPASHSIQPLALPRRIHYSAVHKTVELEPAPGGLFESYYKVVGRIAEGSGQAAFLAVHQEEGLREKLEQLAGQVAWTAVADRRVDRDLSLGALRILTAIDGERDIAAFARSTATFRRPLREVARRYNTFITNAELDDLLRELSELLDSGLLNVKPDQSDKTNENRIKGLLATLIAARWYRQDAAPGSRLLISLDSLDARRWMRLSEDPLRADLVGFEWSGDRCKVEVIEVKAVESSSGEYRVEDGVASGPAVDQMLSTRRLLKAVLATERDDELVTTPARREVLREHLYRELTKAAYEPGERKLWSERLQKLLDGQLEAEIECGLIHVRLGVDQSNLNEWTVHATDGEESVPTRIRELNEEQIEALVHTPPPAGEEATEEVGAEADPPPSAAARPTGPPAAEEAPEAPTPVPGDEQPEADAGPPLEEPAQATPSGPRALLGTAPGSYGNPREIWFDPNLPGQALPNPHISITGETGSGKTQATKAITADLKRQGIPALILDFKDDYSDSAFVEAEDFRLYDASFSPLPFNPLTPAIDKRQNLINPAHHLHQIADIIKRIYKLGDQQAFRLREAIKSSYQEAGISLQPTPFEPGRSFPPFDVVQNQLRSDKANEALLGRLSPIFDLGLFTTEAEETNFEDFLTTSAVIRLGQLPSDEVKNSVAEFFLMALYNYLIRQPQTHRLGRLLILDEAWRVVESPFLTPLMREGRAFGLGVIVASQFPRDLPEEVRGSTATRLFFSQGQVEQIREIQRTVVGKTSGADAEDLAGIVRSLSPLSCILHSSQYPPFVRVTISPYFERWADDGN
jgi:hypothetical protein